jgi:hypothetical protein
MHTIRRAEYRFIFINYFIYHGNTLNIILVVQIQELLSGELYKLLRHHFLRQK